MTRVALAALLLTLASPQRAAAESQIWTSLTAQARLGEKSGPTLWLDLHDRRRSDSTLYIVRPALGYTFSPAFSAFVGYAYIPTDVDDGDNTDEQRIWQQVIWNHAFQQPIKVQGRARFEQRFGPGDDVGYRLRLLARAQVAPLSEVPMQLVLTNELFIGFNDTDWSAKSGFDQNRLFVGLGADTKLEGVRVELGYMSVYLNAQDRFDNIVAANVTVTRGF
jgi:hypothetical protein